jgi:hypothetical protein
MLKIKVSKSGKNWLILSFLLPLHIILLEMSKHKTNHWLHSLFKCPCCGETIRFNWWWLIDIDTYFYCKKCGVKLAQISFVVVVVMVAFAIGLLYNRYQDTAVAHDGHNSIAAMACFYFLLIAVIRVILLFVIFNLKFAKNTPKKKRKNEEELWWEPFVIHN